LIHEIVEPSDPPAIVLKYLDDNLLNASVSKRLQPPRSNMSQDDVRFTDVQIADCSSTVPADSAYAKDGDMIGASIWRSPEAQLGIGWGTPTDIWSFGALVRLFS
jgi:hypothetical protein